MKKWIEDLLKLQGVDMRIRRLSTRLDMIPTELSRIDSELEQDQEELKKAADGGRSTELEIKQVESDIAALNDEADKLRKQSAMVRKNDEYRALMSEIDTVKNKISDLETRELELMDAIDEFKNSQLGREKAVAAKAESMETEKRELGELENDLKRDIDALNAKREELIKPVDGTLLSQYQRLLGKGVGEPLVIVRKGNCGNCHLRLTPQTVNMVRKGVEVACENCGHLLYVEDGEDPGSD